MEEQPRIGIVGRWVSHWSFWPTYAAGVIGLLAMARPWAWERPLDAFEGPTAIMVYDVPDLHGFEGAPVGTIVITIAKAQPDASWLPCDGRRIARADHPALAALAGDRFGSDAQDLVLPDMPSSTSRLLPADRVAGWLQFEEPDVAEALASSPDHVRFWIKVR